MTDDLDQPKIKNLPRIKPLGSLVGWLVLVPIVFGTLVLFSELAVVVDLGDLAADTRSLLQAQYQPWPYDEIPPINILAFFSDIQQEIEQLGTPVITPTIQEGVFWVPPTPESTEAAQATPQPIIRTPTSTATDEPIPSTATAQATSSPTALVSPSPTIQVLPSSTATQIPRTATPTVTLTSSPTATIFIVIPTNTNTPEPEETSPARATLTNTPPAFVLKTPTFILTMDYVPVRPIAENNGKSIVDPGGQGCLAYFGYQNYNPFEIDIPIGERNFLSQNPVRIAPGPYQPTHFYTSRVSSVFEVVWNDPVPLIWYLDGNKAAAQWCNP